MKLAIFGRLDPDGQINFVSCEPRRCGFITMTVSDAIDRQFNVQQRPQEVSKLTRDEINELVDDTRSACRILELELRSRGRASRYKGGSSTVSFLRRRERVTMQRVLRQAIHIPVN